MIGNPPIVLNTIALEASEYQYIQYMPIAMPGLRRTNFLIPDNLKWVTPLLESVYSADDTYVYVTAKHMWVDKDVYPNRAGWHIDGYLTDDVSYIWYDSTPTEFCIQPFDLSPNHEKSLVEMEQQVKEENIVTYPVNTLLLLDNTVVHRVASCKESGYRTFVKINVSKEKYALKGNAKNPLIDYNWEMLDRNLTRNCPQMKGTK